MMVLKLDESGRREALSNYLIIRRNGAVVPFEPQKIAVALMKAFLSVRGASTDQPPFGDRVLSFFENVSGLKCRIQLYALNSKRATLAQGVHMQRHTGTGVQVGAGVRHGFFSAAKPNLCNAP